MLSRLLGVVVLTLTMAGRLFGQEDTFTLDQMEIKTDVSTMVEWAIGAVFVIGCLVIAFKPAKRANLK